jgi:hypothetical protein
VNTVLSGFTKGGISFEYLNDYELLEDSPPSLQLFNDLSTLLTILQAERSGVSIPSRAGHVSHPQNV